MGSNPFDTGRYHKLLILSGVVLLAAFPNFVYICVSILTHPNLGITPPIPLQPMRAMLILISGVGKICLDLVHCLKFTAKTNLTLQMDTNLDCHQLIQVVAACFGGL
jgi:hypothetical protein